MKKPRVLSFYAGPGTGKSTTAARIFSELKELNINCEYVQEYVKDAPWEKRRPKVFAAQEYIFGKQHFRLSRVASEVDIVVTDSPIVQSLVYLTEGYPIPSLVNTVLEAHALYDNLDVFLKRDKLYNPSGRSQTLQEAEVLDRKILSLMRSRLLSSEFHTIGYGRQYDSDLFSIMQDKWGDKIPELLNYAPSVKLSSQEMKDLQATREEVIRRSASMSASSVLNQKLVQVERL